MVASLQIAESWVYNLFINLQSFLYKQVLGRLLLRLLGDPNIKRRLHLFYKKGSFIIDDSRANIESCTIMYNIVNLNEIAQDWLVAGKSGGGASVHKII